jgi:hypothetical protein
VKSTESFFIPEGLSHFNQNLECDIQSEFIASLPFEVISLVDDADARETISAS